MELPVERRKGPRRVGELGVSREEGADVGRGAFDGRAGIEGRHEQPQLQEIGHELGREDARMPHDAAHHVQAPTAPDIVDDS